MRANKRALASLGRIISVMEREGRKRKAPVNSVHAFTRGNPFRTLVFTILSARTRDENTLDAASRLLAIAPTPKKLARMETKKIERLVRPSGFYRVKARSLGAAARMLVRDFNGKVPDTMKALVSLPGVGRKTANIVLAYAFGKDAIAVDTHVHRISNRLGLVGTKTPEKTELALIRLVPRPLWRKLNHALVSYGQAVCLPRGPKCGECPVSGYCWRVGVRGRV